MSSNAGRHRSSRRSIGQSQTPYRPQAATARSRPVPLSTPASAPQAPPSPPSVEQQSNNPLVYQGEDWVGQAEKLSPRLAALLRDEELYASGFPAFHVLLAKYNVP